MQRLAQGDNAVNAVMAQDWWGEAPRSSTTINLQVGKLGIGPETFRLLVGTRRQRRLVNGHWYIQYPLAVLGWEADKTS